MPSFLSKVFGRKHHDKDEEASPLSPGELLEGRFEAISPNVSPTATRFLELDSNGKPLSGAHSGVPVKGTGKDKDNVFGMFKGKSRPSSPEVQHKRLLDTLPHLKLDFETTKKESQAGNASLFNNLQTGCLLSDAVIGQRRLNPMEALVLIRACSKAITSRGLEALGIMTPHWYSSSPEVQQRLISHFLNSSTSTTAPSTALSASTASPVSSFEEELNFTRSPHDVAAVLRWGLRHLQLDNNAFGSSEGWYQSFLSSEAASNYPPKAFSEQLASRVPANHLEVLVATLEIFSSLAAFSETNSTSGSKLSKIFGLWLLAARRVEDKDDWRTFYERWERTGRMLEHLFLARIRDDSTDRRLPVRLLELVRKYPYTQGLAPPATDHHLTLLPRPQFSTISHDALYVRMAYELPTTGTTRSKKTHRIHPSTLIADAFSGRLQHDTEIEVTYATRADFVELWEKITMAAQRTGTEAPLSSVFADDTIRLLALVLNRRKEHVKTPAFTLLSSIAAQSPVSALSPAQSKVTSAVEPTSALSPLGLDLKTNGNSHPQPLTIGSSNVNGVGHSWERFSTAGFLETSVPPLASTLFDTDVEKTEPPARVESEGGVSRKSSGRWGSRKSGEVPRLVVAPPMEAANSSSSGQSTTSQGPSSNPNGERKTGLRQTVKPTHMSIIQLDEAFVDFWSDALLDPISADWPTFVICKFKTALVNELTFGSEAKAAEEGSGSKKGVLEETETSEQPRKEVDSGKGKDKKDANRTIKYIVLEQVYTVRQPSSTTAAASSAAPPLNSVPSSSESATSPISPQSASGKKRFSFWNPVSRSPSTSSVGSLKGRKSFGGSGTSKTPKIGEMGELGEVVEEEGEAGKDKAKKDIGKVRTPTSTPPKKKRKSFDLTDLGLKIGSKDKDKDKETKEEGKAKAEPEVPATIPQETSIATEGLPGKIAAAGVAAAVSAGAAVGVAAAALTSDTAPPLPVETSQSEDQVAPEGDRAAEELEPELEPLHEAVEGDSTVKQLDVEQNSEDLKPAKTPAPVETEDVAPQVAAPLTEAEPAAALEQVVEKEESTPDDASPSVAEKTKPTPEVVEYKNVAPSGSTPTQAEAEPAPATEEEISIPAIAKDTSVPSDPTTSNDHPQTAVEGFPPVAIAEQETPSITVESVERKSVEEEQESTGQLGQSDINVPVEPEADASSVKDVPAAEETAADPHTVVEGIAAESADETGPGPEPATIHDVPAEPEIHAVPVDVEPSEPHIEQSEVFITHDLSSEAVPVDVFQEAVDAGSSADDAQVVDAVAEPLPMAIPSTEETGEASEVVEHPISADKNITAEPMEEVALEPEPEAPEVEVSLPVEEDVPADKEDEVVDTGAPGIGPELSFEDAPSASAEESEEVSQNKGHTDVENSEGKATEALAPEVEEADAVVTPEAVQESTLVNDEAGEEPATPGSAAHVEEDPVVGASPASEVAPTHQDVLGESEPTVEATENIAVSEDLSVPPIEATEAKGAVTELDVTDTNAPSEQSPTEDAPEPESILNTVLPTESEDIAAGEVASNKDNTSATPTSHHGQEEAQPSEAAPNQTIEADEQSEEPAEGETLLADSVLIPDEKVASAEELSESHFVEPAVEKDHTEGSQVNQFTQPEVVAEEEGPKQEDGQVVVAEELKEETAEKESEVATTEEPVESHPEEPSTTVDDVDIESELHAPTQHDVATQEERGLLQEETPVVEEEEPHPEADSTSRVVAEDEGDPVKEVEQIAADKEDLRTDEPTALEPTDHAQPQEQEALTADVDSQQAVEVSTVDEEQCSAQGENQTADVGELEQEAATSVEPSEEVESDTLQPTDAHDNVLPQEQDTAVVIVHETPAPVEEDAPVLPQPADDPVEQPATIDNEPQSLESTTTQEESAPNLVSNEPHTEPLAIPDETSKEALIDLPAVPVIEASPVVETIDTVTVPLAEPEAATAEVESDPSVEHSEAAEHVIESGSTPGPQLSLSTGEDTKEGEELEVANSNDHILEDSTHAEEEVSGPTDTTDQSDTKKETSESSEVLIDITTEASQEPVVVEAQEEPPLDASKEQEVSDDAPIKNLNVSLAQPTSQEANDTDPVSKSPSGVAIEQAGDTESYVQDEPSIEAAEEPATIENTESSGTQVSDDTSIKDEEVKKVDDHEAIVQEEAEIAPAPDDIPVHDEDADDAGVVEDPQDAQHAKGGTEESDKTVVATEAVNRHDVQADGDSLKSIQPVVQIEPNIPILVEED